METLAREALLADEPGEEDARFCGLGLQQQFVCFGVLAVLFPPLSPDIVDYCPPDVTDAA